MSNLINITQYPILKYKLLQPQFPEKRKNQNFQPDRIINSSSKNQQLNQVIKIKLNNKKFSLQEHLKIDTSSKSIKQTYYLIKNNMYVCIKDSQTRVLLCRRINKMNSNDHFGSIQINLYNGSINYSIAYNMSNKIFKKQINSYKQNTEQSIIYAGRNAAVEVFQRILNQILQAANMENDYNLIKHQYRKSKQVYNFSDLIKLNNIITASPIDLQSKNQKHKVHNIPSNSLQDHNNIKKANEENILFPIFLKQLQQSSQCTGIKQQISDQIRVKFNRHLIQPIVKTNIPYQNVSALNEIILIEPDKIEWKKIDQSANSIIQIGRVEYYYKFNSSGKLNQNKKQSIINKILIMKSQKFLGQRIIKQKQILNLFAKYTNAYVAKYYFSNQDKFKTVLFGDFYGSRNLRIFIKSNHLTLSLFTIMHIMGQIIQALRFLQKYQIMHLDLKPQNIIISKGVNARLIDFNSAQTNKTIEQAKQFAYTIPYTAPQIFLNTQKITQKADIYSLMIIMYEILFDTVPHQQRFNSQLQLNIKDKLLLLAPQRSKYAGPTKFINLFTCLILKGLNCIPTKRPHLDWLLLMCRESIYFLDKIY